MTGRVVLLHLGAHRTGTTYLQSTFERNEARLRGFGVHYERAHDQPGIRRAIIAARRALEDDDIAAFERLFAPVHAHYARVRDSHPEHLLISYEGFLGNLNFARVGGLYPHHGFLLQRLLSIFEGETVRCAFGIRSYDAMVESSYKRLIIDGHRHGFAPYWERIDAQALDWAPLVRNLKGAMGDDLILWNYEAFAKDKVAFMAWLLGRAFGAKDWVLEQETERRDNASLSARALPIVLAVNRHVKPFIRPAKYQEILNYKIAAMFPPERFGHPDLLSDGDITNLRGQYSGHLESVRSLVPGMYRADTA